MRLVEASVDRYGPIGGWSPALGDGLTVLSGPNEAGKTLYLEAVVQLLDPAVAGVLDPPPRYGDEPVGRVVLEYDGERFALGTDRGLCGVTNLQPEDIPTVFVVRDSDLAMPDGTDYYTSLIEHLGEVHTSAIEAVEDELRALGRLTATNLNLSKQFDQASQTRDGAVSLRDDIVSYLEDVEAEGIDDLQRDRIALERELEAVRREHAIQTDAAQLARHDRLTGALTIFTSSSERLDELAAFTHERLEDLRDLERSVEGLTANIADREAELDQLQSQHGDVVADLDETTNAVHRHERRIDAVEAAEAALEAYRTRAKAASGADRTQSLGRATVIGGGIGTGLAAAAGAVTGSTPVLAVSGLLLLVTLIAGGWAYRAAHTATAVDTAAQRAVVAAQDAGLEVERVDAIAPAIEAFNGRLSEARARQNRLEGRRDTIADEIEAQRAELDAARDECRSLTAEFDGALAETGVDDLDAFATLVTERGEATEARRLAEQRLVDGLGDVDAPEESTRIDAWADRLDAIVEEVDLGEHSPDTHDAARLDDLDDRLERLEREREAFRDRLNAYDAQLDRFVERARDLRTQPFMDTPPALDGRSPAALEALVADIDRLIETIEADADASRRGVELLRAIRADEQQQITDLFDPNGPTSRAFHRITGGRYDHVNYDPSNEHLVAERADGETVGVDRLSAGATDQLYLASRLSLADRLLDGEPGFLLLDEPLATADPDRLRRGFEALVELADGGWQLVYLTSKDEVYEDMVDAFDLVHEPVDPIA